MSSCARSRSSCAAERPRITSSNWRSTASATCCRTSRWRTPSSWTGASTEAALLVRPLVHARHGRRNAAARREGADDAAMARPAGGDEVVEQAIDHAFVEDALVAEALQVELERL